MNRLFGRMINLARKFQRQTNERNEELRQINWHAKLVLASIICVSLAVLGLFFTDRVQNAQRKDEQQARLKDAARAWAVQKTLLELGNEPKSTSKERQAINAKRMREIFEKQASEALGLREPPATPEHSSNVFGYVFDEGTKLRAAGMSIIGRGSLALLVISILLVLALIVVPFVKNLIPIGERRVDEALKPGDGNPPSAPNVQGVPILYPAPGQPPVPEPSPHAHGLPANVLPWSLRQGLIPAVVAVGAVIAVGALLINVVGQDVSVTPEVRSPHVGLNINDFAVAVQPGRVEIPATQIFPSDPKIAAEIPKVEFHFPPSPIEQEALTALARELAEQYRDTLHQLAEHNQRLAQQQEEVIRQQQEVISGQRESIDNLNRDNDALRLALELRPTQEQLADLTEAVKEKNKIESDLHNTLEGLKTAADVQQYGDRIAGRQYARNLNAQNRRLFNQIFRPGFIRENCVTYDTLKNKSEIPDLPDCIQPWIW